jgi:hypothetical protein
VLLWSDPDGHLLQLRLYSFLIFLLYTCHLTGIQQAQLLGNQVILIYSLSQPCTKKTANKFQILTKGPLLMHMQASMQIKLPKTCSKSQVNDRDSVSARRGQRHVRVLHLQCNQQMPVVFFSHLQLYSSLSTWLSSRALVYNIRR